MPQRQKAIKPYTKGSKYKLYILFAAHREFEYLCFIFVAQWHMHVTWICLQCSRYKQDG